MDNVVEDMRIHVSQAQVRQAMLSLGKPAALDEVVVLGAAEAFMALVAGNIVRLEDGRAVRLFDVEEEYCR